MSEWMHTQPPYLPNVRFSVWLDSGDVRTVVLCPLVDPTSLWFTDCTHPLQNAFCARRDIKAWRLIDEARPSASVAVPNLPRCALQAAPPRQGATACAA